MSRRLRFSRLGGKRGLRPPASLDHVAPMGEGDLLQPIWRTWLAATLAAWMLLVVGAIIGVWTILETVPVPVALAAAALLLLAGPALLAAALWAMMRDPVTGWIAPSAMLFFLGGLGPALGPLSDLGARLNFERHRPAYEAIIADAKAGRLVADREGRVEGRRGDVRFRYRADRPSMVDFAWAGAPLTSGVRYNESACTPAAGLKCLDRGKPLADRFYHYAPTIADLTFRR
jgi:hypothetical protein